MGVQCVEVGKRRDRHKIVPARVADEPLYFPLVIAFARATKPIREQIVRLQLAEHARALALAIAEYAGDRDLRVVVEDRPRHALEEGERLHVSVAEGFRRLRRICNHEDRVGMRQVHRKEMDFALDAADYANGFAKIYLGMAWRMRERHKHLLRPLAPPGNIVLHNRDLAREAVFVAKTLENALAG